MAAAVKHHKSATPKVKALAEVVCPDYDERDPYRLAQGIRAWATQGDKAVPAPWATFPDARMPAELSRAFYGFGFAAPTPIQAQVWPVACQGLDVIGIARTGSGKTLAYLYPAYLWMGSHRGSGGVRSLILAPTRELATQIHEEAGKFAAAAKFTSACVYGGVPKKEQLPLVRAGAPILVATPGRLNDFLESRQISLQSVGYLVFDEADRMLDMGFEPQIRDIVKQLPRRRQTLMFSATWPEEVQALAHDFLQEPLHIQVGDPTALQANEDISQQVVVLAPDQKDEMLLKAVRSTRSQERVLVFVAMKKSCDLVARTLRKNGVVANAMHSDKDQQEREEALQQLRSGAARVLVATDVAARGLDVKGIALVVLLEGTQHDLSDTLRNSCSERKFFGLQGVFRSLSPRLTLVAEPPASEKMSLKAVGIAEVMEKAGCPVPAEMQQLVAWLAVDRVRQRQAQARQSDQRWEDLPKVLMVAEKPSVAKLVAESLSNGRLRFRKGQSRAVQVFEFVTWFPPAQQKCRILQTSTIGHIFGLDFEDGRPSDLADLFYSNVKKTVEGAVAKNRIVEHIQELASEAEYLALWLDCDREGENICYEVMSLCSTIPEEMLPCLRSVGLENVYRAHFSALTQPEIKHAGSEAASLFVSVQLTAFKTLGRPDKQLAMAVDARQELDLKIGVTFTRLMTRTFLNYAKEKFRVWDQTCLSYGPCQTPTLWFCVERHKEIEQFQRQDIFTPTVTVNIEDYPVELSWEEGSTLDAGRSQKLQRSLQARPCASLIEVTSTRKRARRPVGLNTVQLLKAASTGLGMSPAQCMKVAEGLYSSGYISYPRTETTKYSDTFDLVGALREQANHPSWGRLAEEVTEWDCPGKTVSYLLRQGSIRSPVSGTDKGDHPPITPMRAAPKDEFSKGKEWRLYDYVTRHFIASLMDDAEYDEICYIFDVSGERFVFTYHEVAERGFLYAMPWKVNDLKLEEIDWQMPDMAQGDQLSVDEVAVTRDTTKPPDYLRESELVALMDKNGIGTDASIPQHMQNVVDRHYVMICGPGADGQRGEVISKGGKGKGRKGKGKGAKGDDGRPASRHMVPTPMGLSLLAAFEELDAQLCRPPIRAFMEKQVAQIAEGLLDKPDVTAQNLDLFHSKFLRFRDNISSLDRFFMRKDQMAQSWSGAGHKRQGFLAKPAILSTKEGRRIRLVAWTRRKKHGSHYFNETCFPECLVAAPCAISRKQTRRPYHRLGYSAMSVLQEKAGVATAINGTSGTEKVGGCRLPVKDASDFVSFCRKHCMEHLCSNGLLHKPQSLVFFVPAVASTGKGQNKGGKGKGGKK
ncbi:TOP3B [Symbiodinium sp. CCMP2592]|nr:TOP3B [Symbiodinium sp. CCMP2592]